MSLFSRSTLNTRIGAGLFSVFILSCIVLWALPQQANADQCSINGRDCYYGYFFNNYDGGPPATGTRFNVVAPPAFLNVHNAEELINNVASHMSCSGGNLVNQGSQNATGSAFIILTMLGYAPGTSKNVACQAFGTWAQRVRDWAPYTNYDRFYNFGGLNTRSTLTDVAYYPSAQTEAWSIVFNDPVTGAPLYAIKKDCANPVGRLQSLPELPYALTPYVNNIPDVIETGSPVAVSGYVNNNGAVVSRPTQWEITQITVKPGKKAPHEDENATISAAAPCQSNGGAASGDYFKSGDADCKNVDKGSKTFNPGTNAQPPVDIESLDLPAGTRVCFALSVQPRTHNDNSWAHSKPECTVVGKKPKVQIWGGDVAVRGMIETSLSVKNVSGAKKVYGSWVEYGGFAVGTIANFATGSGLIDQSDDKQLAWSKLTFANKDNIFGNYTNNFRPAPTTAALFESILDRQPVGGTINLGNPTLTFKTGDPVRILYAEGNVTIASSGIPIGRSVVVVAKGTVTIEGEGISYNDGDMSTLRDIPQAVIVAKNINIIGSVKRVDAWLVASDTINTCSDLMGSLTIGKCNTMLEVNGPVITNKLILNRTAGSEAADQSGDPAERFNLRPDAYLWARLNSIGSSKAQTVYSTELPPRF